MSKTKKIVIMSGLVLLLAVTAVFNFVLASASSDPVSDGVTAANYFTTYRTERNTARNEELLQLDSIIENSEAGSDVYEEAMALKLQIVGMMERELLLETYIKSLGYEDAVVSIGMDSDNVNVFVNATELEYNDFLSIYNILTEEAGCDPANVNIMPIHSENA
ncbi:MAG TPA: SpoIIIAH-like family protein [Candidatus Borkfalkia excrementavium]|uniref:SpoIIIAH-like family protein n=1 Tax=Candidatus Borkfalkia excrementavium TaxID=2838505 RepID=A0A9D1ZBK9_9FIRM|nr:SpoIIIAH-like family protein [Candidatus Borkfalkia excrementavium]